MANYTFVAYNPNTEFTVVPNFAATATNNTALSQDVDLNTILNNAHVQETQRLRTVLGPQFTGMSAHYNAAISHVIAGVARLQGRIANVEAANTELTNGHRQLNLEIQQLVERHVASRWKRTTRHETTRATHLFRFK